MSFFFETLYLDDNKIRNLRYHNARLNKTIKENFGSNPSYDLSQIVDTSQPHRRCKVIYDSNIVDVQYYHIIKRSFKCLKIIEADIDYKYKFLDRRKIDELFVRRGECDDIIIVHNGRALDTSIANIAIFDGKGWITPATPLLHGTMRASLIDDYNLVEEDISIDDILNASKIAIMNAIFGFMILDDVRVVE